MFVLGTVSCGIALDDREVKTELGGPNSCPGSEVEGMFEVGLLHRCEM
jgi:hypothetical protein